MKSVAEKLIATEKEMAEEKGPFVLFGLFLREDSSDLWDLLVSASWISKDKEESLRYIAGKTGKALLPEEVLTLSRIVVIEEDNPALDALIGAIRIEHGVAEIQNSDFFGLQIKHAYLITSKRAEPKDPITT
jgi:hypothetical protein